MKNKMNIHKKEDSLDVENNEEYNSIKNNSMTKNTIVN